MATLSRALVVLGVLCMSQADSAAAEVELGGLPIVLPCDARPAIEGSELKVICGKIMLGAEVGQFGVEAYITKLAGDVPEDKRTRQTLDLGGKKNAVVLASMGANTAALFVVEDIVGGQDLAMVMVAPAAEAEAAMGTFQKMVTDSIAAIARRQKPAAAPAPAATPTPAVSSGPAPAGRVAFSIVWAEKILVSFRANDLRFARDRNGNIPLLLTSLDRMFAMSRRIHAFESGGHTLRPLQFTVEAIAAKTGLEPFEFEQLDADADGNLIVGIIAQPNTHNWFLTAFAWVSRSTGAIEPIAPLSSVLELGDGSRWGNEAVLRAAADGTAWLFVKQGKDAKLRIARVRRESPGVWKKTELTGFDTTSLLAETMDFGSPDPSGGYIFFSNGALWRIAPDGKLAKLGGLEMPKDTTRSRLVVTPNGDIWIAFSMLADVSQWQTRVDDNYVRNHVAAMVAGESQWMRVRFADGKMTTALIYGDDILAALKKATPAMPADANILKTPQLRVDYHTGGLIAFDTQQEILFALKPAD